MIVADNTDDEMTHIANHVRRGLSGQRRNSANELIDLAASAVRAAAGGGVKGALIGGAAGVAADLALKASGLDEVLNSDDNK